MLSPFSKSVSPEPCGWRLWSPSVKAALYQIDTNDQTATPSGYLDISAYAASTGGLWQ